MKTLELNQMEVIEGGSWLTGTICGLGFGGFWGIIQTGFWAAGVATGGVGIIAGLAVMAVGAAVCSFA